ncbi:Transglycosylase SLT domain-containing protein [Faunimonas pinastri]|uniref:Transglycosylase SLT domain-containing protein n=1 Tax=Faunimonas pinastri TaxID=1855383 RepID=A0A1H9FSW2_9HYPH|nr:Transglycosylase SLT domain-containing protein [Faunimonas pinastri]
MARANAPAAIESLIAKHARANGIPVELARAVVQIESRFNPRAAAGGAIGLMQIKAQTARGVGYHGSVAGLYDPETNITYGMKYLAQAHELGGGSVCRTILKYNAGVAATSMNATSARYCSMVKSIMGAAADEPDERVATISDVDTSKPGLL